MDLVDTARYPIHTAGSAAAKAIVARCARSFASDGVVALANFVKVAAIEAIAAEVLPLIPSAYFCRNTHNVFLDKGPGGLRSSECKNDADERMLRTTVGSIANDHLQLDGALQQLYEWPHLTSFIGAVLGYDELHRGADPLGALSVNVYGDGDQHGWHFDEARFTVTLSIQAAAQGGHFEYVTGLRGEDFVDRDGIARVLDGDSGRVRRLPFEPGTLLIFGGRHTLHRVSPVAGPTHRLVPVLTYDTVPGSVNTETVRTLFWGRTS